MRDHRLDHVRRLNKIYLMVNKKYLVNFLSERYFGKKQMMLIFVPVQLLAVWATVSTPLFNTIKYARTGSQLGQSGNADDTQTEEELDRIKEVETQLELMRTLIDTAIGAILLIITNLSKALNFERKAEQHKMVSDEMKTVLEDIELHLKTLPKEDFDKEEAEEIFLHIEDKFEKGAELSRKLTPPDQIIMAFENLEDDIQFLMCRKEDDVRGVGGFHVRRVKTGFYEVDEDTYNSMFKDGYSDLADIISANMASWRFACLPASERTRTQTIGGLTQKLNRMSGAIIKMKSDTKLITDEGKITVETPNSLGNNTVENNEISSEEEDETTQKKSNAENETDLV